MVLVDTPSRDTIPLKDKHLISVSAYLDMDT
jgi:hypothetical protein